MEDAKQKSMTQTNGSRGSYDNGYDEDAAEVKRAMLEDDDMYLNVPLRTIYKIIALDDVSDEPADVVKKVQAWNNTLFFAKDHPSGVPLLYTPATQQILMWPDTNDNTIDLTKSLVTVIPDMAQVKLTDLESILEEGEMATAAGRG